MAQENGPVKEIRYGRIRAAVWANESSGRTWFNVKVVRTYKEGDDVKDATTFGRDDLPIAALALTKAYAWICEAEESQRKKAGEKAAE